MLNKNDVKRNNSKNEYQIFSENDNAEQNIYVSLST